MGTFEIIRVVHAEPVQVWRVVTDWARHADWVPLTRMRLDEGETRVGWSFAGLTGVGPIRLVDTMVITGWAPPGEDGVGSFRLVKTGRLLAGWAEVAVEPSGPHRTLLRWREDLTIRPLPLGRLLAPLADPLSRRLFARVITAMAQEAQARQRAARQ